MNCEGCAFEKGIKLHNPCSSCIRNTVWVRDLYIPIELYEKQMAKFKIPLNDVDLPFFSRTETTEEEREIEELLKTPEQKKKDQELLAKVDGMVKEIRDHLKKQEEEE